MSDTVDIGAARVRLIVDAADFEPIIQQGQRAITGFGQVAQQAYDRTEKGTRRAADALLDYVNSLGRADTTMDKYIRTASRMGVEKPILDAAITAWARHNDEVEQAAEAQDEQVAAVARANTAYKELVATQVQMELQARKVAEAQAAANFSNIQQARAANAQQAFNTVLGVSTPTIDYDKRQAAEEAFAETVARENAELEQQAELTELIAQARGQQNASTAQEQFNRLLGIGNNEQQIAIELSQRRNDAMAAFLPMLEDEAKLENENNQLVARQQAFISELENTAKAAGKTHYEMLQLRADELGLGEAYAPLIAKIKDQNQAMGAGTLSAKQYEFALRGLPAQFTDIVVSLQGGQRPLTVLLQQGGQIKDMFGGVGQAVKVVGKQVLSIVSNPLFVLAGVAALVGTAFAEATTRTEDFAVATAKGNLLAGNAKGLSSLADQLSKLNNISIGNADQAVQSLAAAGKLTGTNFALAAEAAARWSTVTGQSADNIIGKFNELANDPMQAVLDGTLKVTEAQYEQLEAFERTGQKAKEAQLAVKLYADQINNDSASVLENLSAGAKGWIDLKDAITGAWHSFTQFAAEAAGAAFNHLKAPTLRDLATAGTGGEGFIDILNQGDQLDQPLNGPAPQTTRSGFGGVGTDFAAGKKAVDLTTDQVNANKELQKSIDDLGTKQQKYNAALVLENGLLSRASDGYLRQANIVKDAAGAFSGPGYDKLKNGLHLKIFGQTEGGDPTKPIKEWEKTALDALKGVGDAQQYLYQQGSTDTKTYYAIQEGLVRADEVIQLESIEKQSAALKARNNPNDRAALAALQQQALTVRQTTATAIAKLDHDELLAIQAKTNAYHDYVQSLADANIALSRQGDQAVDAVGTGSRQQALAVAIANAKNQADLRDRASQDAVDKLGAGDHSAAQADADKQKEASAAALSTQLDILKGNYDSLATAEASWLNGSTKAFQDWSTSVQNQAMEAGKVFTEVMDGVASSIADAATKGKLSFSSLISTLLQELVTFGAKQAELLALKQGSSLLNGGSSSSGDYGTNFGGLATSIGSLLFSAKGNVFPAGTGLSSYRNSVVSSPTVFPFAKGGVPNVGVMGEKGSEGIFPLTRTPGGELGVKAVGNNQQKVINTNQYFIVPNASSRQTQDQLAIKSFGAAQRAARRS